MASLGFPEISGSGEARECRSALCRQVSERAHRTVAVRWARIPVRACRTSEAVPPHVARPAAARAVVSGSGNNRTCGPSGRRHGAGRPHSGRPRVRCVATCGRPVMRSSPLRSSACAVLATCAPRHGAAVGMVAVGVCGVSPRADVRSCGPRHSGPPRVRSSPHVRLGTVRPSAWCGPRHDAVGRYCGRRHDATSARKRSATVRANVRRVRSWPIRCFRSAGPPQCGGARVATTAPIRCGPPYCITRNPEAHSPGARTCGHRQPCRRHMRSSLLRSSACAVLATPVLRMCGPGHSGCPQGTVLVTPVTRRVRMRRVRPSACCGGQECGGSALAASGRAVLPQTCGPPECGGRLRAVCRE